MTRRTKGALLFATPFVALTIVGLCIKEMRDGTLAVLMFTAIVACVLVGLALYLPKPNDVESDDEANN